MTIEARKIFIGAFVIILFGVVSSSFIKEQRQESILTESEGAFACTMDAKVCPDGSYVGRIAPYCQFAACHSATLSQDSF